MASAQQFTITLPFQMAERVKAKVKNGHYSNESEVIQESLQTTLLGQDEAIENWLTDVVAPAYDALKADPSRAVSIEHVRSRINAEHAKRQ